MVEWAGCLRKRHLRDLSGLDFYSEDSGRFLDVFRYVSVPRHRGFHKPYSKALAQNLEIIQPENTNQH